MSEDITQRRIEELRAKRDAVVAQHTHILPTGSELHTARRAGLSTDDMLELARLEATARCVDCGGVSISTPDHEGFIDCFECGAAWIPGATDQGVGRSGS